MDQRPLSVTGNMISTARIHGADVLSPKGEHLGQVQELLIDKQSGRIAYAVIGFGGFLGIGAEEYPLPWGKLRHDNKRDAYITDVTAEQLQNAPNLDANWQANREWERNFYGYYALPPYWI